LDIKLKDFLDRNKDHVKKEIGEFTGKWEEGKLILTNHKGYKFEAQLTKVGPKNKEYDSLSLVPVNDCLPEAPALVQEILFHFMTQAEDKMKNFSKKTGWVADVIIMIKNEEGQQFVATRNQEGIVKIVSSEEFLIQD